MKTNRLLDYLDHLHDAATQACNYIEGMSKEEFLSDKRTQQAVILNLIIIGEVATKLMDSDAEFVDEHSEIPWRSMRGMRNRLAHGYFDINLHVVWDTLTTALPDLLERLPALRQSAKNAGEGEA